MQTPSTTIIPTAVLQECAIFAFQNGLKDAWTPFYEAALAKIAGTTIPAMPSARTRAGRPRTAVTSAPVDKIAVLLQEKGPMTAVQIGKAIKALKPPTRRLAKAVAAGTLILEGNKYRWAATPMTPMPEVTATVTPKRVRSKRVQSKVTAGKTNALVQSILSGVPGGITRPELTRLMVERTRPAVLLPNHAGIAISREWKAGRIVGDALGPYTLPPMTMRTAA